MDENDINFILSVGSSASKYYASYCDTKAINKVILDFTTSGIITDKRNHAKSNIEIHSQILELFIDDMIYKDEDGFIIFPIISFRNMFYRYGYTKKQFSELFNYEEVYIEFKRINKKRYEIVKIKNEL